MRSVIVTCAAAMLLSTVPAARASIWDPTRDFSLTNGNPNGAWTYGWVNGSSFQACTDARSVGRGSLAGWCGNVGADGTPAIVKNFGEKILGIEPGQIALHPGPNGQASVLRWTAPEGVSGYASLQGQFLPGDMGIMHVGVFKNGIGGSSLPIWDASDSGVFNLSIPIESGNTIDFAVYGSYLYGATPLTATITVPEPSTIVLLALGGIGLMAYTRKKRCR